MNLRAEIERLRKAAGLRPGPSSVYEATDERLLRIVATDYEAIEAELRDMGGPCAVEELEAMFQAAPWARKGQGQA